MNYLRLTVALGLTPLLAKKILLMTMRVTLSASLMTIFKMVDIPVTLRPKHFDVKQEHNSHCIMPLTWLGFLHRKVL